MNNENKLLTIEESAEYVSASHWTIRKWIRQKRIPFVQINSRVKRIKKDDLDKFINSNLIPAKKIS